MEFGEEFRKCYGGVITSYEEKGLMEKVRELRVSSQKSCSLNRCNGWVDERTL